MKFKKHLEQIGCEFQQPYGHTDYYVAFLEGHPIMISNNWVMSGIGVSKTPETKKEINKLIHKILNDNGKSKTTNKSV